MKSLRCRQAPISVSHANSAIAVHLIRDCAYREATLWCELSPSTYDGVATDHLFFKSTAGGHGRFATTARFQVTCQKCLRMSQGLWRPNVEPTPHAKRWQKVGIRE